MTYETALQNQLACIMLLNFLDAVASSLNAHEVTMVTKFLFWHGYWSLLMTKVNLTQQVKQLIQMSELKHNIVRILL